jgi:thiamine biosynthesis protein ThiS
MDPAMANNVTISVNGDLMEAPSGTTVAALLQLLDVETARIAVELDGNVAQRERWCEILITPVVRSWKSSASWEVVRRFLRVDPRRPDWQVTDS